MLEEEKQNEVQLDDNQDVYSQSQGELSRGQKIAAFALGFFAFFIVIIWALQFKSGITDPLDYEKAIERARQNQAENETGLCPSGTCADLTEEDLKTKDTDGDGLWDWDELNVYSTSPYLEDSDSDGFTDKEEIDTDNNPNCAAGRECSSELRIESEGFEDLSVDAENLQLSDIEKLITGSSQESSSPRDENGLSGEELRKILEDSGVDGEILKMFSDEELMEIYSSTVTDLEE